MNLNLNNNNSLQQLRNYHNINHTIQVNNNEMLDNYNINEYPNIIRASQVNNDENLKLKSEKINLNILRYIFCCYSKGKINIFKKIERVIKNDLSIDILIKTINSVDMLKKDLYEKRIINMIGKRKFKDKIFKY